MSRKRFSGPTSNGKRRIPDLSLNSTPQYDRLSSLDPSQYNLSTLSPKRFDSNNISRFSPTYNENNDDLPLLRARQVSVSIQSNKDLQLKQQNKKINNKEIDMSLIIDKFKNVEKAWQNDEINNKLNNNNNKNNFFRNNNNNNDRNNNNGSTLKLKSLPPDPPNLKEKKRIHLKTIKNKNIKKKIIDNKKKLNPEVIALRTEKKQMEQTINNLITTVQQLTEEKHTLALQLEQTNENLKQASNYALTLNKQAKVLNQELEFQNQLYLRERQVWKRTLKSEARNRILSQSSNMSSLTNKSTPNNNNNNLTEDDLKLERQVSTHDEQIEDQLTDFRNIIENLNEQIKHKNEKLEQIKKVHESEMESLKSSLSTEIKYIKNRAQTEIEELHMRIEESQQLLATSKLEQDRLSKTLEMTQHELNANLKLLETKRPKEEDRLKERLFRIEQDYLTLTEMLTNTQQRLALSEQQLTQKTNELDDSERTVIDQRIQINELKENCLLLQQSLDETKEDRSDLINVLQQEWENSKQNNLLLKQKLQEKQKEIDRYFALELENEYKKNNNDNNNITKGGPDIKNRTSSSIISIPVMESYKDEYENKNNIDNNDKEEKKEGNDFENDKQNDSSLLNLQVLLRDTENRCNRLQEEIQGQQLVIQQLLEQQRAFNKRNKALSSKNKLLKKKLNNIDPLLLKSYDSNNISNNNSNNDIDNSNNLEELFKYMKRKLKELSQNRKNLKDKENAKLYNDYDLTINKLELSKNSKNKYNPNIIASYKDIITCILQSRENLINKTISNKDLIKKLQNNIKELDNKNIITEQKCNDSVIEYETKYNFLELEHNKLQKDLEYYKKSLLKYESESLLDGNALKEQIKNLEQQLQKCKRINIAITNEYEKEANLWLSQELQYNNKKLKYKNELSRMLNKFNLLLREREMYEHDSMKWKQMYFDLLDVLEEEGIEVTLNDFNLVQEDENNNNNITYENNHIPIKLQSSHSDVTQFDDVTTSPKFNSNNNNNLSNVISSPSGSSNSTKSSPRKSFKHRREPPQAKGFHKAKSPRSRGDNSRGILVGSIHRSSPPPPKRSSKSKSRHTTSSSSISKSKSKSKSKSNNKTNNNFYNNNNNINIIKEEKQQEEKNDYDTNGYLEEPVPMPSSFSDNDNNLNDFNTYNLNEQDITEDEQYNDNDNEDDDDLQELNLPFAFEDAADDYLPFDETDEFNFLDEEYKEIGMKVIKERNYYFDIYEQDKSKNINSDNSNEFNVEAFAKMQLSRELQNEQKNLPKLEGYLEKRSPTFARGWQRRYVIVKQDKIFYSKNKIVLDDYDDEKQHKKFLNVIPLLVVQYVVATDQHKTGKKFELVAKDPRTGDKRHYQWRTSTRELCKYWVEGIEEHKKLLISKLQFLSTNIGKR